MSLAKLLAEREIQTALIVDDVYDAEPTATDIGSGNEAWPNFFDDLTHEQKTQIIGVFPAAASMKMNDLINTDKYVAAVWGLRETLGEITTPLFENYIADQTADEHYVTLLNKKLTDLGLTVSTAGRNFTGAVNKVDLVIIDLFFGKAQDSTSLDESKKTLRQSLQSRLASPPLVILMSRSSRLESKRDEFRDDVGLLDSGFRILKKEELENTNRLELQLERLAENRTDSLLLAKLFHALEVGVNQGAARTLRLLRKLRLSDIGQIQQLLLKAEGQPVGSYLVDVFDRVLQHEIERETDLINAALAMNSFSTAQHPPPYVAGSADLQELVQRILTQNENRLQLSESVGAKVAFGDLLQMAPKANAERLQHAILVDITPENILLVLTPACDLQRCAAPRILLLIGTVKPLAVKDWSYSDDARTAAIRIDDELRWVKWNLKHIDIVSNSQLEKAFEDSDMRLVGRLRESHALELQQRVLAGLGRVGQMAALPATFPVELAAFYPNADGRLIKLEDDIFSDGAVCFVGRDNSGSQVFRLVMTETSSDKLLAALETLEEDKIAQRALPAFRRIKLQHDLRRVLTIGLDLKKVTDKDWKVFNSEGGTALGLLAWNYPITETPLSSGQLGNAGVVLLISDANRVNVPGLDDAIRSGLIKPAGIANSGSENN